MSQFSKFLLASIGAFGLASCTTIDKVAALLSDDHSLALKPLQRTQIEHGYELHRIDEVSGKQDSWKAIEVNAAGDVTALNSEGCTFQFQSELFSPILMWENCGSNPKWNSGTRTIVSSTGSLWPLAVGNNVEYEHEYEFSSGNKGSGTRACKVSGIEMSVVPMGEYPAFVVNCRDDFGDKFEITTWHISPEVGEIRYMREHSENGLIKNVGVDRIVMPSSS